MRRFLRSDWNFSSTAEPATAVMLAAAMILAFLRLV
jgi:hypothetical protein